MFCFFYCVMSMFSSISLVALYHGLMVGSSRWCPAFISYFAGFLVFGVASRIGLLRKGEHAFRVFPGVVWKLLSHFHSRILVRAWWWARLAKHSWDLSRHRAHAVHHVSGCGCLSLVSSSGWGKGRAGVLHDTFCCLVSIPGFSVELGGRGRLA